VKTPVDVIDISHNPASKQHNNEKSPEAGVVASKQVADRTLPRLEDIKMDLNEIGSEGVDWIYLAQIGPRAQWQAVVNTAMNFRFVRNLLTNAGAFDFSLTLPQKVSQMMY
jgi:hypothetical protein